MNPRRKLSELAVLSALAVACNPDKAPLGPAIGAVQVSVTTTGVELQTHGYSVSIDSGVGQAIPVNGTVMLAGLSAGSHSVLLDGVAPNCTVAGTNPLKIAVRLQETTQVSFAVACVGPVDVSGVWDFTERWNNSTCGDTGSYSFTQTGDTFVGTAIGTTSCWGSLPDSVHGQVVGSSVTFHGIEPFCGATDHTADVSGDPPSQMAGTATCSQFGFSSTWHAVHHAAVGSVTVAGSPEILPVGAKSSLVFALIRDTAGHPVFFRTAVWSSANQAVATAAGLEAGYVEPTGVLQGISPGSAMITATVEGRSGSASVTVIPWDISGTWTMTETLTQDCGDPDGVCEQCSDAGSVALSQNGPALNGTINRSDSCRSVDGVVTILQESYGVSGDASLPPGLTFRGGANGRSCSYSGALELHRPLSIYGDVVCSVGDGTWSGSWGAVLAGQTASPRTP